MATYYPLESYPNITFPKLPDFDFFVKSTLYPFTFKNYSSSLVQILLSGCKVSIINMSKNC